MVAVGSCLVVAGGWGNTTVEVLDTHFNRVWNLPQFGNHRDGCNMVTANQVAVIGGVYNFTCATLPLMDRKLQHSTSSTIRSRCDIARRSYDIEESSCPEVRQTLVLQLNGRTTDGFS